MTACEHIDELLRLLVHVNGFYRVLQERLQSFQLLVLVSIISILQALNFTSKLRLVRLEFAEEAVDGRQLHRQFGFGWLN